MFIWADLVQRSFIFYHAVPGTLSVISSVSTNLIFYHAVPVYNRQLRRELQGHVPARSVQVCSTSAAGDSFIALRNQ